VLETTDGLARLPGQILTDPTHEERGWFVNRSYNGVKPLTNNQAAVWTQQGKLLDPKAADNEIKAIQKRPSHDTGKQEPAAVSAGNQVKLATASAIPALAITIPPSLRPKASCAGFVTNLACRRRMASEFL
jgi:hypothetical protein